MFDYARSDTHFLLFVYDKMRNELLERNGPETFPLQDVLKRSEETCLRTYVKEIYDPSGSGRNGWANILQKWHSTLNDFQLVVFKALHLWRDQLARELDESPRYVMLYNQKKPTLKQVH